MKITENSIENLYRGLGHEYYTASKLWQMGFEAYKMDADFGFDIFAFNERGKIFNKLPEKKYFFQVKSKMLQHFNTENRDGAGDRNVATTKIFIKKDDLERLLKEENAILICHLTDKNRNYLANFWMDNKALTILYENGFFHKTNTKDNIALHIEYRSEADSKNYLNSKIENLLKITNTTEQQEIYNQLKNIKTWIDKSTSINQKSNINIRLYYNNENSLFVNGFYTKFENFTEESRPDFFDSYKLKALKKANCK